MSQWSTERKFTTGESWLCAVAHVAGPSFSPIKADDRIDRILVTAAGGPQQEALRTQVAQFVGQRHEVWADPSMPFEWLGQVID